MKKQKYNVSAMDDNFLELNRDSAILSISSVPGLPQLVRSNNGSIRFSDEIKGRRGKSIIDSSMFKAVCFILERCYVQLKCTAFNPDRSCTLWN